MNSRRNNHCFYVEFYGHWMNWPSRKKFVIFITIPDAKTPMAAKIPYVSICQLALGTSFQGQNDHWKIQNAFLPWKIWKSSYGHHFNGAKIWRDERQNSLWVIISGWPMSRSTMILCLLIVGVNRGDILIPVGPLFSHPPKRFTKEKYFCLSGEKVLGVKDLIFDL